MAPSFAIFGDNIIECERGLGLLTSAVDPDAELEWIPSSLACPQFAATIRGEHAFTAVLFPGYGRWSYDVLSHLRRMGAPLREGSDAIVVRIGADNTAERIELAFEFSGALPAGNNAWQRSGRALSNAEAGVPYLYFAELGGAELNAARERKAGRLPSPVVPFSHIAFSDESGCLSSPIYQLSPSASVEALRTFAGCLDSGEGIAFVRQHLFGGEDPRVKQAILDRALSAVRLLAATRRRDDTFSPDEWTELASVAGPEERVAWMLRRALPSVKRVTIQRLSGTIRPLIAAVTQAGAVAPGANVPFCLLTAESRPDFSRTLMGMYGGRVGPDFLSWVGRADRPLAIVWVCGFKPRGDDSRPDRGLVPLARMTLGRDSVDLLTVVYGPGTAAMWQQFAADPHELAATNGLWQAIVQLSDAVLVDSATAGALPDVGHVIGVEDKLDPEPASLSIPARPEAWGEHDVDSVLHLLFSTDPDGIAFEGMCNPPGGDWSGVELLSARGERLRWISLPRVSGPGFKRPDHVVAIAGPDGALLAIESKERAANVEPQIGPQLRAYLNRLWGSPPNVMRSAGSAEWRAYDQTYVPDGRPVVTAAAFLTESTGQLQEVFARGEVDLALGLQFDNATGTVLLHILGNETAGPVLREVQRLATYRGEWLEVRVHNLAH